MSDAIVVVHFDESGEINLLVHGENVRLLTVDDRTPNDRVYETLSRVERAEIDALLGTDVVGSMNDDRHEAIAHRLRAAWQGKPHLEES